MAVPKRKTSPSRRGQRRSHDALQRINVVFDETSGEAKLPHHISLKDGYYNKRKVLDKVKTTSTNEAA
ncbi:50S ribosomal protein L32 [Rickettsiales endosymbiont of Peranema trichophorum]|uniref:50S ribosomal protein L32 n=1 Tax=Rickettsiales endosymbiont of Peranema trichophorum TaxID=2486577 RepID=UPI001022EF27|nr:50S ribosomal protein L32 [Rickettsiales endosymbiont of Peranema trichophorum]RZI47525.1 50S ribosomal protein L32 [Rickettsiales endosymbiont of Peranema trichophorum]